MSEIIKFPGESVQSPELIRKFSEQHNNEISLKNRREILLNMDIDEKFAEPLAIMLNDINATTSEIMDFKVDMKSANDELFREDKSIELNAMEKRNRAYRSAA